jgi:hypothetical protein
LSAASAEDRPNDSIAAPATSHFNTFIEDPFLVAGASDRVSSWNGFAPIVQSTPAPV